MTLTLTDLRRIASDVAQHQHPSLEVLGVTKRTGSSTSAEVIFAVRDCQLEPCRFVVGVSRQVSEIECRGALGARLTERLAKRVS
jgi:hypothetical protein